MGRTGTLNLVPNDLPQTTGHHQGERSALKLFISECSSFSTLALCLRVSIHEAQYSCLCPYCVSLMAGLSPWLTWLPLAWVCSALCPQVPSEARATLAGALPHSSPGASPYFLPQAHSVPLPYSVQGSPTSVSSVKWLYNMQRSRNIFQTLLKCLNSVAFDTILLETSSCLASMSSYPSDTHLQMSPIFSVHPSPNHCYCPTQEHSKVNAHGAMLS